MVRKADPNSPAAKVKIQGDCLSEVPFELLELIVAYHKRNGEEPLDTNIPVDPIPE